MAEIRPHLVLKFFSFILYKNIKGGLVGLVVPPFDCHCFVESVICSELLIGEYQQVVYISIEFSKQTVHIRYVLSADP